MTTDLHDASFIYQVAKDAWHLTLGCPHCTTPMHREADTIVYACPACPARWQPAPPRRES